MIGEHLILAVLWIVYCVLHSVLANNSVKQWFQYKLGKGFKYYRIGYTLFAFLFLVILIGMLVFMKQIVLFNLSGTVKFIGGMLAAGGLLLMFICIKKYFFSLSGLKTLVYEKASNELIITGVHKYMRHPLYTGTFVFIWGLLLVFPYLGWLISIVIITAYTIIAIAFEEEKLVIEFGEAYKEYQKKVPKLLPHF